MAVKDVNTKGKALAEDEIIFEEDLRAQKPKGMNLDEFFQKYKNIVLGVLAVIVVGSVGYFFYSSQLDKKNTEALDVIGPAIKYFEGDSIQLAISGDGVNPGFETIVDEYSGTKTGNLACFYLGLSYLQMKPSKPAEAIEQLEKFKTKDDLVSAAVLAALASAYEETGEYEKAANSFVEAAGIPERNTQTSPFFLKQAARNYETADKNDKALKIYQEIKRKYPLSEEGQDIDRFIAKLSPVDENF